MRFFLFFSVFHFLVESLSSIFRMLLSQYYSTPFDNACCVIIVQYNNLSVLILCQAFQTVFLFLFTNILIPPVSNFRILFHFKFTLNVTFRPFTIFYVIMQNVYIATETLLLFVQINLLIYFHFEKSFIAQFAQIAWFLFSFLF